MKNLILLLPLTLFASTSQVLDYFQAKHAGGECAFTLQGLTDNSFNRKFSTKRPAPQISMDLTPFWRCHFIKQHLRRDNYKKNHDPSEVFAQTRTESSTISGKISYMGFAAKKYQYDLIVKGPMVIAEVRIHFEKEKKLTFSIQELLDDARDIWLQSTPKQWMVFSFKSVEKNKRPHYIADLEKNHTRGPYDRRWSEKFSATTAAHELGHMMGLDDEYDNLKYSTQYKSTYNKLLKTYPQRSKKDIRKMAFHLLKRCDDKTLMCSSGSGDPQNFYYFQIFKRDPSHTKDLNKKIRFNLHQYSM